MASVYNLGDLQYRIDYEQHRVTSIWPDGTTLDATPNHDSESTARARALGYDDVWQMTIEHDLAHHLLAQAHGQAWCPLLRNVATGQPVPANAGEIERTVLLFQHASNAGLLGVAHAHRHTC